MATLRPPIKKCQPAASIPVAVSDPRRRQPGKRRPETQSGFAGWGTHRNLFFSATTWHWYLGVFHGCRPPRLSAVIPRAGTGLKPEISNLKFQISNPRLQSRNPRPFAHAPPVARGVSPVVGWHRGPHHERPRLNECDPNLLASRALPLNCSSNPAAPRPNLTGGTPVPRGLRPNNEGACYALLHHSA
jgi:hypothetical protein